MRDRLPDREPLLRRLSSPALLHAGPLEAPDPLPAPAARRGLARDVRRLRRRPGIAIGLALLLAIALLAALAPAISPYGVNEFAGAPGQGPNGDHWFGTDRLGQDLLSRVLHGARTSLVAGFGAVIGGGVVGMLLGAWSGYRGGWFDLLVQRAVDTLIAFPMLVLLLVIARLMATSLLTVMLVIAIAVVPVVARVVRGAALVQRQEQYIEAALAAGASERRVLLRHLLPNVAPLALVLATTLVGAAIVAEASLSFLGLGVPPPNPSWGADISAAREAFPVNAWAAFIPGIALTVTVLGAHLLGDGLRDLLDPRSR